MIVIKRDGREVPFDSKRIENAIIKALKNCDYSEEDFQIAEKIAKEIEKINTSEISVELIQDIIERKLMASHYKDAAKAYITYRQLRNMARNQYKELMDAVSNKLGAKDVQNQNANVDEHSFGGRIGEASRVVTKQYALDYCMSKMAKENHLNNEIYIHN